jgi:hypothetical protein
MTMTPAEKIRRGEEAERLLANETFAAAFTETAQDARAKFFGQDYDDDRAKVAWAVNAALDDFRERLRRYVGEKNAEVEKARQADQS